jgi:hypothetical protein
VLLALYRLETNITIEAYKALRARNYKNAFIFLIEATKKSIEKIRIAYVKTRVGKTKQIPVLYLYSQTHSGDYKYDNEKVIGGFGQILRLSHIDREIICNSNQDTCVGRFENQSNIWYLVNDGINDLALLSKRAETKIAVGNKIKLMDEQKLVLSRRRYSKIAIVKFI